MLSKMIYYNVLRQNLVVKYERFMYNVSISKHLVKFFVNCYFAKSKSNYVILNYTQKRNKYRLYSHEYTKSKSLTYDFFPFREATSI